MKENRQIQLVRMGIYLLIWTLLILFPILSHNRNGTLMWNRVYGDWIRLLPFLFVFFIHHYGLLPLLGLKNKRAWYLVGTLLLVVVVSALTPHLRFLNEWIQQVGPVQNDFGRPPQGPGLEGPGMEGPRMNRPPQQMPPRLGPNGGPVKPVMFYNLLVSILLVGFDAAIALASKWFQQEQKTKEVEKMQLETELAFLRNQISPHFFMNTLNNIHALIEVDKEKAQEAVIRLSKLMRYLLYETGSEVLLSKEFEFISSYFDLMKIRYSDQVKISLDLPVDIQNRKVHPLLFISFIENAFKYGISYEQASFVKVRFELNNNFLEARIVNTIHDQATLSSRTRSGTGTEGDSTMVSIGGIGQENARKQLNNLYGDNYTLTISEKDETYFVYLKIPVNHA